ncbi:MAG: tyrosine--tRNA ligase [Planctomycetes bacterium]|nr:tyrosine--tRNA ligase [Planctomycetota bacterium]
MENSLHEQIELLTRGTAAIYSVEDLAERLKAAAASGRQLRVKLGLDPTAPDIHLGHTVVLNKMRQFQDLGHKAVLIIGDYTARIGDPTGQNTTRPMLSAEQIQANATTYINQAAKVLDVSEDKLEIRYNSEWLEQLSFADVIRLAAQMTVARMLERDTFELRYKAGVPIGVHEFLYPLMQGYDSVCIEADVELGGTDQTYNNLVGRQLQANAGQRPQIVMVMPILVGLDGVEKMSKSKGNYIGVTDEANDMFGKVMSIPDALMANYLTLLTDAPLDEVRRLTDPAATHPRQAKADLGRRIVARFHGGNAAEAAAAEFDRIFAQRQAPTDMPEIAVSGPTIGIVDLIRTAGFAATNSEARRLIVQNAVSLDDARITDVEATVEVTDGQVLRVGKRRFGRIRSKPC